MMTNKELGQYLMDLGEGVTPPQNPYLGLCCVLSQMLKVAALSPVQHRTCGRLMTEWPGYSGDSVFPVPPPHKGLSANVIFNCAEFLWEGEYGAIRKRMCFWIGMQLKGTSDD